MYKKLKAFLKLVVRKVQVIRFNPLNPTNQGSETTTIHTLVDIIMIVLSSCLKSNPSCSKGNCS